MTSPAAQPPEFWGGLECTVNRVGDVFRDQTRETGHETRLDDLDRFAELGIRTLRYPCVWERVQPVLDGPCDWGWLDERIPYLRKIGVRPIAGLVHHGSGPRGTRLDDPSFSVGLGEYAGKFARRFPWIDLYTPVNEVLTTARFSGLYGVWYPHGRDDKTFLKALFQECRGVVLAMQAVRAVNPDARLVQTEDLGTIYGPPHLRYQVDFENERRWLTWDLLCGRVDHQHPLAGYLRWAGATDAELGWFLDNPCPPDVLGINHYVTSDRYLDHRLELYPAERHGGNGRHRYVDVEAVRVRHEPLGGVGPLLKAAAARYGRPVAITEAHLGCTREHQMRWLHEVWRSACAAKASGVDVRAVTAWSLLGAVDWNSLVTRQEGHYESGVYDLRSPRPRETQLAKMVRSMSAGGDSTHPVLDSPGWWRHPTRLVHPCAPASSGQGEAEAAAFLDGTTTRPLLVVGAGRLGRAFERICTDRGIAHRLLSRRDADIADPASVELALERHSPWAVVNTAGYARVNPAERDPDRCFRENTTGAAVLARACARRGLPLITFSSHLVFDGRKHQPYRESDPTMPISVYGLSKSRAESEVLAAHPEALVVRTSTFFGPWDEANVIYSVMNATLREASFAAPSDVVSSPTYIPDLVHAALDLLIDGERGLWHLANRGEISIADLAREALNRASLPTDYLDVRSLRQLGWAARRPPYSVLTSERGNFLPSLDDALDRYFRDAPKATRSELAESL